MSQQCRAGIELDQSITRKTPTPHNQPIEGRKRGNGRRRKERTDYTHRKALALLLKPASPTPSNIGSLRSSFQREKDTKVQLYWEMLQWCGANECPKHHEYQESEQTQRQRTTQRLYCVTINLKYNAQLKHLDIAHAGHDDSSPIKFFLMIRVD